MTEPAAEGDRHRQLNEAMSDRLDRSPGQPIPERGYGLRVLQTRGRVTGGRRKTPIGLLRVDGGYYLVSPDRRRDWVRNLLSEPRCSVSAGGIAEQFDAVPVVGPAGASVVRSYLEVVEVPWALRAFPVRPSASMPEIEGALGGMAVFRLDRATTAG